MLSGGALPSYALVEGKPATRRSSQHEADPGKGLDVMFWNDQSEALLPLCGPAAQVAGGDWAGRARRAQPRRGVVGLTQGANPRPRRLPAGLRQERTGTIGRVALAIPVLIGLALIVAAARPAAVAARPSGSVVWDRYDVTLDLRNDGSYHVVERQQTNFQGGPFRGGFADIPLGRIDSIGGLVVSEETSNSLQNYRFVDWNAYSGAPGTYTATRTSAAINVKWGFPPTTNQTRLFRLEYDVIGALRVYPNNNPPNQQIWWTAISKQATAVAPIKVATTTIHLPRPVDPSQAVLGQDAKEKPQDHTKDGQTWLWQKTNLAKGDDFTVRLQFPPLVNANPPSWQQADDARRQKQEAANQRSALLNVVFLGIGLLFAAGGGLGVYGLWYARGRDPHTGLVADFLPQPPDSLPPGGAGTLLDETADERDVVATLVDLGRRGVLQMDETENAGTFGLGGGRDFQLTLVQPDAKLTPFETELVSALFSSGAAAGTATKLSEVKSRFQAASPRIKELLYSELVTRGYFPRSPEATRTAWRRGALIALVVIVVGGCVGGGIAGSLGASFVWLPIAVAAILALVVVALSGSMPRKTPAGAEAAAKWRAFRKYLADIEKYEKLDEAKGVFDKNLPYAIAFGLEQSWVGKFASVGAQAPDWYGPVGGGGLFDFDPMSAPYGRRRGGMVVIPGGGWDSEWGGSGGGSGGTGDGGGVTVPDLQDASDRAGRSLQGSSNSLMDMLNSAAKAFDSFGGGGGGGGGWGGGGGFGGGGSSDGSSGGGDRGFS